MQRRGNSSDGCACRSDDIAPERLERARALGVQAAINPATDDLRALQTNDLRALSTDQVAALSTDGIVALTSNQWLLIDIASHLVISAQVTLLS